MFYVIMGNYLYMYIKNEPLVVDISVYTVHVITDVCECEIVPVFFFNITCASRLHVKHLLVTRRVT